jgi:hypothetical protein
MTIKAQTPVMTVGERFTYATPDGRFVHYRVSHVDVPFTRGCARLQADEPGWADVLITAESLASSYGWAGEEGVRDQEPGPAIQGTGAPADPGGSQRQDLAACPDSISFPVGPHHPASGGRVRSTGLVEPVGRAQGRVFGVWDAPVTDDDVPIATPAGNVCAWCEEPVREGDSGRITDTGLTVHRECSLRTVMGGIGHLVDHERYCHGIGPDAGLSRRASSLLVWDYWQETHLAPSPEQLEAWKARLAR